MSLKTILSKVNKTNHGATIDFLTKHAKDIAIGAGVVIGGAGALDYIVNDGGARAKSHHYTQIQERNNKNRDEYRRRQYRTPQELYGYKTGHSNSWGGNKY